MAYCAIPKIVWTYWHQGWDAAPRVARASVRTWCAQNPAWRVHRLDRSTLSRFVPDRDLAHLASGEHLAAQSDQIRIELLHRYGGVWADATTMCMAPMDEWLPSLGRSGFFAFRRPEGRRMLASWFIAAERGNYLVERWRAKTVEFWQRRASEELEDYFWFHHLFGTLYQADPEFRRAWDDVPAFSAIHRGHFGPDDKALLERVDGDRVDLIESPPAPVLKLTHKIAEVRPPDCLLDRLCEWAEGTVMPIDRVSPRRLLVAWYGAFAGHGTVGDVFALETLVTHLVGRGHRVSHATADRISIVGSERVQWDTALPNDFDAVMFVCGPILSFHPRTNAFFQRFASVPLAGVGVSMMPASHPHHTNPFRFVLAREGWGERHGDLAILAPQPIHAPVRHRPKIGLSLRGRQTEYGEDRCLWQQTESLARELAKVARERIDADILDIENHLARSGRMASEIEAQYGECSLVITSRFHGAIAAIRQGVPYVAIDQIKGGAKLTSLLAPLSWPHVYRIDQLDAAALRRTCAELVTRRDHPLLLAARRECSRAANETLAALDRWLSTLPP